MSKLSVNIKALMKNTGLSRSMLAYRLDIGETTIKNIETGYSASPEIIERIAEVFGTTAEGLSGQEPLEIGEKSRLVYVTDCISGENPFLNVDNITDAMFVDKDSLAGFEHIGFKVGDNSMSGARLCKGDIVLVRQGVTVKNGDIVLAACGRENATLRRYFKKGNTVTLCAESSDLYADTILNLENDKLVIIGKVVRCIIDI